jgi:N-methylhydantoinase A/oxoprolinase/acetone carboxylase beta subunit
VVVIDGKEVARKAKILTNQENLLESVLFGMLEATAGIDPKLIQRVVVSTTLATNAIVEGRLEPVGVVVASGPGVNPGSFAIGEHFYSVQGAIDHRGREIAPLRDEEIRDIGRVLKAAGIRHVAVVGKFSTRNPGHELRLREILGDGLETVAMGHQVSGQLNFPRRIATTYLNAAVAPISRRFYEAVQRSMERQGLRVPLEILKADGGTMAQQRSLQYAVETILSGPAASVMGTLSFADSAKEEVALDIGGTTTDIAILVNGVPLLERVGITIGGYRTLVRALLSHSIGVGGDSWVRVENGALKVGPERKGRAMAYGGPEPTPTDALIALGAETSGHRQRAIEGIQRLGYQLDQGVRDTADMIVSQTCSLILGGIQHLVGQVNGQPVYTIHQLLEGKRVDPRELIIIGAPAREIASRLGAASGWQVRVPPDHEVANAIGAAVARTTCEVTVVADTALGCMGAPEEGYGAAIDRNATEEEVIELALTLLRNKALRLGADGDDLTTEILEAQQFNMVKGFHRVGRNIRVRAQVKPGLIRTYREAAP